MLSPELLRAPSSLGAVPRTTAGRSYEFGADRGPALPEGVSGRPAARSASHVWIEGLELETVLDEMNDEELKKITWLEGPPKVGRGRNAPATMSVTIEERVTLCRLLGVGASRCVYAVGARYAIKYEYGDPIGRSSNIREADLAKQYPAMLPWTLTLANGCLLVRQAAYTVEHLVEDISKYAEEPGDGSGLGKLCDLVKGVLQWAVWLVGFATENCLHLDDSSPRNAGYELTVAKWKVIDAGCYRVAKCPRHVKSVWDGSRNGMHRFKGKYSWQAEIFGVARFGDGEVRVEPFG